MAGFDITRRAIELPGPLAEAIAVVALGRQFAAVTELAEVTVLEVVVVGAGFGEDAVLGALGGVLVCHPKKVGPLTPAIRRQASRRRAPETVNLAGDRALRAREELGG